MVTDDRPPADDPLGTLLFEMTLVDDSTSPLQLVSAELLEHYRRCAILCAHTVAREHPMPLGPPLTIEQLHDIAVRRDASDIPTLLWEIKRLQIILQRVDQVQQGATGGGGIIWDALRGDLDREPSVVRHREDKRKLWADVYETEPGDDDE